MKLTKFRLTIGLLAAAATLPIMPSAQANPGDYNVHLNCNFGTSGKRAGMDVLMNDNGNLLVREDYNTVPAFHAEKVQLMYSNGGAFSTIATWGDGSTGSVKTSFGSTQTENKQLVFSGHIKMKITETGSTNWDCTQGLLSP